MKRRCDYCGKEYKDVKDDEEISNWEIIKTLIKVFICIVLIIWFLWTLASWLQPMPDTDPTLVDILKGQWEWILTKRIW